MGNTFTTLESGPRTTPIDLLEKQMDYHYFCGHSY